MSALSRGLVSVIELTRTGNMDIFISNRLRLRRGLLPRLYRRPIVSRENWSARRVNTLFRAFPDMRRYLEIGVRQGTTFQQVSLPERIGVDPAPIFDHSVMPKGTEMHVLTSDDYFRDLAPEARFDVVFIDGLHTYEQTYTDVCNALRHCPDGAVLIDDVVPSDEVSAMRDQDESYVQRAALGLPGVPWHGDVFRVVVCLNDHHPELEFVTLTGDGNPQLLLWRREQGGPTKAVDASTLARYATVDYAEIFSDGVPSSFAPMSEEAGLSKAVQALRGNRTAVHNVE